MTSIKKAVIAIAGHGSRMKPITEVIPKEMLPIGTTPILQLIIDEVIKSGIKEIQFVINHERGIVTKYLCGIDAPKDYNLTNETYSYKLDNTVNLSFVYQNESKGTADAVSLTKKFVSGEPFALLYGDDIFVGSKPALSELIELSIKNGGATVLGVQHISPDFACNYATIDYTEYNGKDLRVKHIFEKQQPDKITSDITSVGRYILSPNIFKYIETIDFNNGELLITDAIEKEAQNEGVYAVVIAAVRHDTGNPEGYIHAFKTIC